MTLKLWKAEMVLLPLEEGMVQPQIQIHGRLPINNKVLLPLEEGMVQPQIQIHGRLAINNEVRLPLEEGMVQPHIEIHRRLTINNKVLLPLEEGMVQPHIQIHRRLTINNKVLLPLEEGMVQPHIEIHRRLTINNKVLLPLEERMVRPQIQIHGRLPINNKALLPLEEGMVQPHIQIHRRVTINNKVLLPLEEGMVQAQIQIHGRLAINNKVLFPLEEGMVQPHIQIHRRLTINNKVLLPLEEGMVQPQIQVHRRLSINKKANIILPAPVLSQRTAFLGKKVVSYLYHQLYMHYGMVLDGFIDLKHVDSGSHISTMNWNLINNSPSYLTLRKRNIAHADHEHGPHMPVSTSSDLLVTRCLHNPPYTSLLLCTAHCSPLLLTLVSFVFRRSVSFYHCRKLFIHLQVVFPTGVFLPVDFDLNTPPQYSEEQVAVSVQLTAVESLSLPKILTVENFKKAGLHMASERIVADTDPSRLQRIRESKKAKV
ncbi:uncharacterized protein LOC132805055 [Ziziphus jujuba]|uniref:Uncharacterized protein LOC132805055 n=1 Tax=Ziziphus jujuba TaxID=326968 RepID=A0ABM4AGD8_ZIZJJ|nr:uncharacterized protein LOC132805055 [Ziziphus jujuba]